MTPLLPIGGQIDLFREALQDCPVEWHIKCRNNQTKLWYHIKTYSIKKLKEKGKNINIYITQNEGVQLIN